MKCDALKMSFIAFVLSSVFAAPVSAAELALQLETSLRTDSNPFKFYDNPPLGNPNPGPVQQDLRAGDSVTAASLLAGVLIPLASDQTRLILTGSLGTERYKDYSQLNHREGGGDATLDVSVADNLLLQAHSGAGKKLFQYINGSLTDRDLVTSRQTDLNAYWKLMNDFQFNAGLYRNQTNYELAVNQLYNNHEKGGQFFLRYTSPTGSSVQAGIRQGEAQYTDRDLQQIADLDQGYKERELAADIEWLYSTKTIFSGHLGKIRREYHFDDSRDTYLTNVVLRGTYHFSPSLRFDLQVFNRPYSLIDPAIQYVTATGQRLDLSWTYSPKWKMNLSYLHQNSEQQLIDRIIRARGYSTRNEKLQRFGAGAVWQFDPRWRVMLDGIAERSNRDEDGLRQSQRIISLALEYTFENQTGSADKLRLRRYQQHYSAAEGQ